MGFSFPQFFKRELLNIFRPNIQVNSYYSSFLMSFNVQWHLSFYKN
jgi:hypothetical protein